VIAEHLVELRQVRKSFGDNLVLDAIDLSIDRGEAVVVAGPSGSGKSTMLRCINGLEEIDSGEITFDGRTTSRADGSSCRIPSASPFRR
jgi:ABC-type sugar transport system ATPase subunit